MTSAAEGSSDDDDNWASGSAGIFRHKIDPSDDTSLKEALVEPEDEIDEEEDPGPS
eukprot:CAMPEP_0185614618 /NCGR_PEP_ID=MMETSP0436-20130131/32523_1 /TAXON_ID=626734 ORGANISM="Favella taraikaensis, Strain Fe Narragansett Bay" /NCGR_SAMPLE_ID=MMETSP0436 /ASSEMBLY_ACC=CAM_ASM_000390 /LENGTH=55 /DNA_ID=CAMNT_0028249633 /DNA_START=720 /DNA_END=882 /DNA_ORIENTATION=-